MFPSIHDRMPGIWFGEGLLGVWLLYGGGCLEEMEMDG
jgi:hypothetical protein